ncbi:MAG TPA: alpha/beta hydrolase [Propionicimonas sp.]|nr:alpha/beta hydrolase [Propionicimonas sp.]
MPSPSETTALPDNAIRISAVPGPAVDRPTFDATTPKVDGMVAGLAGDGLSGYLTQQIEWNPCDESECAQILAPLDYATPAEAAVTLSLKRKPATKGPRLGTLFINPGGPGASGVDLVDGFASEGLEQYDILGWDPRGTGGSTAVQCFDDEQADAFNSLDGSPDDEAERAALLEAVFEFGKECWQNSGSLLEHITTIETVRDLDLMRQLVGDAKLSFLGYSYGTAIGATYAELFGHNTGRLVLDAAVNITDNDDVIQAMGFDLALGNFASWCAEDACALGSSKDEVLDGITDLLDDLDSAPLKVGERKLTQTMAATGIAAMLYGGKSAWSTLAASIQAAKKGRGEALLWGADYLNSRGEDGSYDPMFFAFPAISCADDSTEQGVLDADRLWAEDQKKAPIFGKYFGPQYICALWPVRPARQLDLRGASAQPLLVIGGTGDNATPYQQAVDMAGQLESAVLVTYQGEGHGTFGGKSECVDRIVVAYLVKGTMPADGVRCS